MRRAIFGLSDAIPCVTVRKGRIKDRLRFSWLTLHLFGGLWSIVHRQSQAVIQHSLELSLRQGAAPPVVIERLVESLGTQIGLVVCEEEVITVPEPGGTLSLVQRVVGAHIDEYTS